MYEMNRSENIGSSCRSRRIAPFSMTSTVVSRVARRGVLSVSASGVERIISRDIGPDARPTACDARREGLGCGIMNRQERAQLAVLGEVARKRPRGCNGSGDLPLAHLH